MLFYDTNAYEQASDELIRQCGNPAHLYEQPSCLLGGGPVELVYFPVQRGNGSLCTNSSSAMAKPLLPGLSEMTTLGHSFTSDSVYLSFKTLYAYYDGFSDRVGPSYTDLIVPLHSTDISSHCGGWFAAYGPGTQLNYADLNWPVPASAYKCQARCSKALTASPTLDPSADDHLLWDLQTLPTPPECATIWEDVNPVLAVPTKIREMVPAWSSCSFWNEGLANFWFDPPLALQEAAVEASVTMPSTPTTTSAAPLSKPHSPTVTSTGVAESQSLQSTSSSEVVSATPDGLPNVPASTIESSADPSEKASQHSQGTEETTPETHEATAPAISVLTEALSTRPTASLNDLGPSSNPSEGPQAVAGEPSYTFDPTDLGDARPTSGAVLSSRSFVKTIIYTSDYYVLESHTITAGQATTLSGEVVSADVSGLVVDSEKVTMSNLNTGAAESAPSVIQADGFTLTLSAVDQTSGGHAMVVIDHTTISEGGPAATVSGHIVSQGPDGLVKQGSTTISFSEVSLPIIVSADTNHESIIAVGSVTITASKPSGSRAGVVVDGTTLSGDSPVLTKSGQTISYGSSGLVLLDAHSTAAFTAAQVSQATSNPEQENQTIWTLASLTMTAASVPGQASAISVHGTTLSEGGKAVIIENATVTLGPSGLEVIKSQTTEQMKTLSTHATSTQSNALPSIVTNSPSAGVSTPSPASTSSRSGAVQLLWHSDVGWFLWACVVVSSIAI
ncbi:hypothetical protein PRZ48_012309 [Zasmidium cellare]|uniref:Uncharacterized protein n=1 Tax=Zasmidium cellare TaxID=395010 RepID=A0ABR0E4I4_ZASCE|nr:hypothetical protein PRZ48_012309 [Zasmidium cellare]